MKQIEDQTNSNYNNKFLKNASNFKGMTLQADNRAKSTFTRQVTETS